MPIDALHLHSQVSQLALGYIADWDADMSYVHEGKMARLAASYPCIQSEEHGMKWKSLPLSLTCPIGFAQRSA